MKFLEKLNHCVRSSESYLCIGLDPDLDRLPMAVRKQAKPIEVFNRAIIEATQDVVCAYKLNLSFYERFGSEGWKAFETTVKIIPDECLIIADGKRNDIGNSARQYARALFKHTSCDAVTVNPLMGEDSVAPFLEYEDKGVFLLCLTSNPGSSDFQRLVCDGKPLFFHIAEKVLEWNSAGNCGLVVGATHPEELRQIRKLSPYIPFLIPGIGTQGGDLEKTIRYGMNEHGENALINSSRAIIYASDGEDFAAVAREKALELRDSINEIKKDIGK